MGFRHPECEFDSCQGHKNNTMKNKKIITGITVAEQMRRAKKILKEQVIPKEKLYQKLIIKCPHGVTG